MYVFPHLFFLLSVTYTLMPTTHTLFLTGSLKSCLLGSLVLGSFVYFWNLELLISKMCCFDKSTQLIFVTLYALNLFELFSDLDYLCVLIFFICWYRNSLWGESGIWISVSENGEIHSHVLLTVLYCRSNQVLQRSAECSFWSSKHIHSPVQLLYSSASRLNSAASSVCKLFGTKVLRAMLIYSVCLCFSKMLQY